MWAVFPIDCTAWSFEVVEVFLCDGSGLKNDVVLVGDELIEFLLVEMI